MDAPKSFQTKTGQWSDPFLLPSSNYIPKTLEEALDFCVFLYHMNPQYWQATKRVVAHFVTRLESTDAAHDDEEVKKRIQYLTRDIGIFQALHDMGDDYGCYGISFWRLHLPFRRFLEDTREGKTAYYALSAFREADIKYHYKELEYEVPDPRYKGQDKERKPSVRLKFVDLPDTDSTRARLRPLDPRRVTLRKAHASGRLDVIWRMDSDFTSDIREGKLFQVNETPLAMLQAVAADQDFLFSPDEIFVFSGSSVSGVSDNGWPVPPVIQNFRTLYQLQVYRKIDEAVARDYTLPFRVLSPPGAADPSSGAGKFTDLALWKAAAEEMIKQRRHDETAIHASALPMSAQQFFGDGKGLTPKDLLEWQTNDMLDAMGYPAELFRASMQVENVPTAIRIFESTFYFIYRGFNQFVEWVNRKCEENFGWAKLQIGLALPSIAGDLEARQLYLQLASGAEISRQKAFEAFNIPDAPAEKIRRLREDMKIEEETAKIQAEFERKQTIGTVDAIVAQQQQAPPPGAAGPGGGGMPPAQMPGTPPNQGSTITPLDRMAQADAEAQRLLQIPDDGSRSKELQALKATNPDMHALVKQKMEERRSAGVSQGRAQAGQL